MSKFVPRSGSTAEAGVAKFVAGAGAPVPAKVGAGESEMGIAGRVQHVNGDGIRNDLSQVIPSIYAALPSDPRLLSRSEKEQLLTQAIEAMRRAGTYTPYGEDLCRRIVGLSTLDGQTDSKQWEAQGATNSQARQKENGGYPKPPEPANKPSSVAKADLAEIRTKIAAIQQRIAALAAKYNGAR